MQQLVPHLKSIHLDTSRLPCHAALRASHNMLTALHGTVETRLGVIDAAAARSPRRRADPPTPPSAAYRPGGLPPADALPSLAKMATPMCPTNKNAQRSLA